MLVLRKLLQFLAPVLLHLKHCQSKNLLTRNYTLEVMPFQDVWNRSSCRPLEKLVDIVVEYPDEVEHIFSPSCVPLRRCAGCCGDEKWQCTAVETANVTMQLLRLKPSGTGVYLDLSFAEHRRCDCRPRVKRLRPGRQRLKPREGAKKREEPRGKSVARTPFPAGNCLT
ncbi:placenta growth factor [Ambystoma mexicanum]|uniref:placenta growth factor n=1 Tax=Ambystoma mexicanum TaxID=8296 RepID=UPI0037E93BD8